MPRTEVQGGADLNPSTSELVDLVDHVGAGMTALTADGTIVWVNRAQHEQLGYDKDELVGRNLVEVLAGDDTVSDALGELARGRRQVSYEAALRAKDGGVRHFLVTATGRRSSGGELRFALCVAI